MERWLSYKGTCLVILLAKLHDMYLYKTDNFFPHQPLFKVSLEGGSLTQVLLYILVFVFLCRFYDAQDMFMARYCDICKETFPPEVMSEQAFEDHQLSHALGVICPYCKMWKDDEMTDSHFQYHIDNCSAKK